MSKHNCHKCNKEFSTKSNLTQHLNKKNPCNEITSFKCKRCNKDFASKFSLERHMVKKVPCINSNEINSNIEFENQIKFLQIKSELELKSKKEIMEKENELKLKLINAKKEAQNSTEKIKSERKERTSKIVNNTQNINNIQNTINHITNNYVTNEVICATKQDVLEHIIEPLIEQLTDKRLLKMFLKTKNIHDMTTEFLSKVFNNDNNPERRNMFYDKITELFYAIIETKEERKEVKQVEYSKYIHPILTSTLDPLYTRMLQVVENDYSKKYQDLEVSKEYLNDSVESMKDKAKIILDEDNSIEF